MTPVESWNKASFSALQLQTLTLNQSYPVNSLTSDLIISNSCLLVPILFPTLRRNLIYKGVPNP